MLGQGWYSGDNSAPAPVKIARYGDRPRLIFQMNVELVDGRTFRLGSDASWKASPGPITYNSLIHGETYDAQREQPGWDRPGFNDANWVQASLAEAPSGRLTAQLLPPARVIGPRPLQHDRLSLRGGSGGLPAMKMRHQLSLGVASGESASPRVVESRIDFNRDICPIHFLPRGRRSSKAAPSSIAMKR